MATFKVIMRIFVLALVVAGIGFSSSFAHHDATATEASYPKDAPAQWDKSFDARDPAGLAAQYSEAVVSMPFNAPTLKGRAALQADFANFFARNEKARHETRVVELLHGDAWAIERADYTLTYTPKTTGKEVVETGRHVVCRKLEGDKWLIAWELWNTDQPVP